MNTAISSRDERAFSAPALLVAGAFFMEFLDGTVIATALPDMARDFGVTAVELNIGISAYLITLAVLIPASGWIADRFGARAIFTLALAIFTLASVFCGLSTEVHIFVAMRILQGVGGALMVPVGRLAVLRTTPKHQLIKAIATLTWPALVAPIIGPPLGGFITRYASCTGSSLSMSRWALPPSSFRCALSLIFAKRNGAPSISADLSLPRSRWSVW